MGYRSDVTIAMAKVDFEKMLEQAKSQFGEDSYVYSFIREGKEDAPKCSLPKYTYLQWLDVKWYDEFDEVIFITNFLREHKNYHLIIIGEEDTDIQDENYISDEWLMGIKREVTFEYAEE